MHETERLYNESFGSNQAEALLSPPDVFAVCCTFAKVSGCYRMYSTPNPNKASRVRKAERDGLAWRKTLDATIGPLSSSIPVGIQKAWSRLGSKISRSPSMLASDSQFVRDVLYLLAAADASCVGLGIPGGGAGLDGGYFEFDAEITVILTGTLCQNIPPSSVRVLPKQHTPQSGFNIRSLTHHLALCSASEVNAVWNLAPLNRGDRAAYNVLLAPWPIRMDASEIRPGRRASSLPEKFGYFDYEPGFPSDSQDVLVWIKQLSLKCGEIGQHIDLLVLPECALTEEQWRSVSKFAASQGFAIVSGIRRPPIDESSGENLVKMRWPSESDVELVQFKHHRWQIECSQIENYGFGGTLCAKKYWWENISINPRELNFVAFLPELVICPLICEDLARQDPVAELVRSVGPNLVVALLMDGPQLAERWSARYATVLADDPGSSVLTVSSLGMVRLSRPRHGRPLRVVASWKDATGSFVPLELAENESALLLNLQFAEKEEWTVDGRSDGTVACTPVLRGVHPIGL